VVGSQDVSTLEFRLKGQTLIVEAEIYVGLSVTGDALTVEAIAARVGEIAGG
jgi:hypothetical protein